MLAAGRVGRPHGLDGSFHVTRPVARLLTLGAEVAVSGRPAVIARRAGTDAHPILRLAGIGDRAGAEQLRGAELTVAAAAAPALGEGEFWAHELAGCAVHDGDLEVGTVVRMLELPSCEALEVELRSPGPALLVPMVKDAIRTIDVQGRRIEIDASFVGLGEQGGAA